MTAVLLTHCHWDHICNFALFPNAQVVVPRPDLEWAAAQPIGTWELPVVGEVAAPAAVLIRPDGYVAWVGEGTYVGLEDALVRWFGARSWVSTSSKGRD